MDVPVLRWLTGHLLHERGSRMAALLVVAAVLEVVAAVGMAYVAGFGAVRDTLHTVSWPWFLVVLAAIGLSFVGYFFAYRGIYEVENGPRITRARMAAIVAAGFGGFLAHGGSALDDYALRASGVEEREASARVSALAGMEHGVLAIIGTAAGIAVLAEGRSSPPADFSVPWSVIPIPGFLIAFWLAERYRHRWRDAGGWRAKVAVFLDSIHLNRQLFSHPRRHKAALAGMAVFWLADALAMWAALAAFGFQMDAAAMFIGYATGMVFTRRTGPLGGAGILMVVLPVTVWYSGAPLATCVIAVFLYRFVALWVPLPFSLAGLPTLRRMGTSHDRAPDVPRTSEPGLQGP